MFLFRCFHRQTSNLDLKPSRLVYDNAEIPEAVVDIGREIRDFRKEKGDLEAVKKRLETIEKNPNLIFQLRAKTETVIGKYNEWVNDKRWGIHKELVGTALETTIGTWTLHPDWLLSGTMADTERLFLEIQNKIDQTGPHPHLSDRYKKRLKEQLTEVKKQTQEYVLYRDAKINYETLLQEHGGRLVKAHEFLDKSLQTRETYEKEPLFEKRFQPEFNWALNKDPSLKPFFESPEGGPSAARTQELKNLFFSTLGYETNNFKDSEKEGFVLGRNFGNEAEKNRTHYPFIYNAWLERRGVNLEEIAKRKTVVEGAQRTLADSGIQPVEVLIEDDVRNGEITDIDLKKAVDPGAGAKAEKYLDYYEKRARAIEKIFNVYRDKYLTLDPEQKTTQADQEAARTKKEEYRKQSEDMERHLNLGKAQVNYFRLKVGEENVKESFVRSHFLENKELQQWLMMVAMRQFARAAQIVDQPLGGAGTNQPNYHPEVRRQLIAMIYRGGVSGFRTENGVEVYKKDISPEYRILLTQLALTKDFNLNLTGKHFLKPETRLFIFLSRLNSIRQTQLPDQKQKLAGLENQIAAREADLRRFNLPDPRTVAYEEAQRLSDAAVVSAKSAVDASLIPTINVAAPDPKTETAGVFALLATELTTASIAFTAGDSRDIETKARAWPTATPAAKAALKMLDYIDCFDLKNQVLQYATTKDAIAYWEKYAEDIDHALKDTADPRSKAFLELMAGDAQWQKVLEPYADYAQKTELNYNLFERREKSSMDYFDRMGLRLEGCYEKYLTYIKSHPEMALEKSAEWDNYWRSEKPEDFRKLTDMVGYLVEGPNKESFLAIFESLHYQPTKPGRMLYEEHAVAIHIYQMIKAEVKERAKIRAEGILKTEEIEARMKGVNIVDRVTDFGRSVVDMVWPPTLSVEMAAGVGFFIGLWKLRKNKVARIAVMAGVAEVILKRTTGRGIIDRANLFQAMSQAIEGTHEAVLVAKGKENKEMKKHEITPEEHTAALFELNTIPFHTAMQWYESTDPDGNPLPGQNSDQLWQTMQIDRNRVLANRKFSWTKQNPEQRARLIVKKAMENFFDYVAVKEKHPDDPKWGKETLKERWVQAARDPQFNEKKAKYTTFVFDDKFYADFRGNPNSLKWQLVRNAEIDRDDIEKTVGQSIPDRVVDWMGNKLVDLETWGVDRIKGYISPNAQLFWDYLGDKAGEFQKWLGEMGEKTATGLYFGREYIALTYKSNRYVIKHFLGEHWEVIKEGVKLPFEVLYGVDQMIVPWAAKNLRTLREVFRDDKEIPAIDHDLKPVDILDPGISKADYTNPAVNKNFEYFGFFQKSFAEAYQAGYDPATGQRRPGGEAFHRPTMGVVPGETDISGTGYYISEVNLKDIGYTPGGKYEMPEIRSKMQIVSHNQAKEMFLKRDKNLREAHVDNWMYPVHWVTKKDAGGQIEKMYIFWRMPLHGSKEFELKSLGRWTEYNNPNRFKHRMPFMVDPHKDALANLKESFDISSYRNARKIGDAASKYAVQVVRLWIGTLEATVGVGAKIANAKWLDVKDAKGKPTGKKQSLADSWGFDAEWLNTIAYRDEKTLQFLDEISGSAGSTGLAMSEFYKNSVNAKIYKDALEKALQYPARSLDLKAPTGWVRVEGWHNGATTPNLGRLNTDWYDGT